MLKRLAMNIVNQLFDLAVEKRKAINDEADDFVLQLLQQTSCYMDEAEPQTIVGTAFEEDYWQVACPNCQKEFEYKGYFDKNDITNCKCGVSFKTSKIEFENGSYIE